VSLFSSTYSGFARFCGQIDYRLEPFQRKIARAAFGSQHELVVLLPRGNGKTTLLAALAVHHVLSVERPAVYVAASSREQAAILYAAARDFASHPALDGKIVLRHLELRVPGGLLKVLAADALKVHGLTPSLVVVDELHAHESDALYVALRSSLHKRKGARMVTISTAGQGADGPLGKLRARCLALPEITRRGAFTDAQGGSLRFLEWSVPDDADVDDPRAVKRANPASWVDLDAIRDLRESLPDLAFRRFVANQWTARDSAWLPAGAWQACAGTPTFEPGERIWVAVDLSGGAGRSDTAVVWINEHLHVGCEIWTGEHEPVSEVLDLLAELAERHRLAEVTLDFWRGAGLASELEQRGFVVSSYPQTDSRLVPASKRLYDAVIDRRLVHPDNPNLNAHVHHAISRTTRRGWRIDRPGSEHIDGVIALAMALDRAENKPAPIALLGWI
jgi:phage terminase large subunit-like protein